MEQNFSEIDEMINKITNILSNNRYPFSVDDRNALLKCIQMLNSLKLQDKETALQTVANVVNALIRIFIMTDSLGDFFN